MASQAGTGVPRHALPEVDAAAMTAARSVDRLLAVANQLAAGGSLDGARWQRYFEPIPDELRDEPIERLRGVARRARAAFGPKDSIRDVFEPAITEPLLDAIDRLLKAIARYEAHR